MTPTVLVSAPSVSSRQLARLLPHCRRILVGTRPVPRNRLVINWGCSEIPELRAVNVLNREQSVCQAVDKRRTFEVLSQANIPVVDFTENREIALGWQREGSTVYGRELTRGSGGEGIRLFLAKERYKELPKLPLYTKFWKCDKEYRVHVFRDKVIDFVEKRKRRMENPPPNRYWIRTHTNGWVFARSETELHPAVAQVAINAVRSLGLDFGAVDLRARANGECRVLEVNSAPGITGTTVERYATAFRKLILNP